MRGLAALFLTFTLATADAVVFYINNDPAVANFYLGHTAQPVFTATAANNLFVGLNSGDACTTCIGNLGIGHSALGSLVSGINNTAIGWDSQYVNVSGGNNTSLGEDALKMVTGSSNTGLGYTAAYNTTTGVSNTAISPNSLYTNTTGSYNVAVGMGSLQSSVTASHNTGIGFDALKNTTGGTNVAVGTYAGRTSTTGAGNIYLGYGAGFYETASNKLFIDNQPRSSEADGRAKALITGTFASSVVNQTVTLNAIVKLAPISYASLPAADDGSFAFCNDCLKGSDPCAASGTGAIAQRLNGSWGCD